MKKIAAATICALTVCSCSTAEVDAFLHLAPDQQAAVLEHMAPAADCNRAVELVWPQRLWTWAKTIVWRESRNTPTAQNRQSSSAGCFQVIRSTWIANAAGVPWTRRYDALANARVAWAIYQSGGPSQWVTA